MRISPILLAPLLAGLAFLGQASAQQVITLQVSGTGADRDSAILAALTEAVRQANGVQIQGERVSAARVSRLVEDIQDGMRQSRTTAKSSRNLEEQVQTGFHGYVRSYRILEEAQARDGGTQVGVEAAVEVFDPSAPRPGVRSTLAVLPPTLGGAVPASAAYPPASFADQVVGDVSRILVQSRRFQVLEREMLGSVHQELDRLGQTGFGDGEQRLAGKLLGADYLLRISMEVYDLRSEDREIRATGESFVDTSVTVRLDFRILDTASGSTKMLESRSYSLEPAGVRERWGRRAGVDAVIPDLITAAGKEIAESVLDQVYPVKVVRLGQGGVIYLNQGGVRLVPGRKLRVFRPGEDLIDPDTGLSLGKEETVIALIEVTESRSKVSLARILDGDLESLAAGDVCRSVDNGLSRAD